MVLRKSLAGRLAANGTYLDVARLNIPMLWLICVLRRLSSCCQLFLGYSAANCKCVATAELIVVIVVLSRFLLLRQLFVRHAATQAGSAGSEAVTESRVKLRDLRLDLSPAARIF
jgi:hypothetical protein